MENVTVEKILAWGLTTEEAITSKIAEEKQSLINEAAARVQSLRDQLSNAEAEHAILTASPQEQAQG